MRVSIKGSCDAAITTRGDVKLTGEYVVTDHFARYKFEIEEHPDPTLREFHVDSVPGELDDIFVKWLRKLTREPVRLITHGGNEREDTVRVLMPQKDSPADIAVSRAVLLTLGGLLAKKKRAWYA